MRDMPEQFSSVSWEEFDNTGFGVSGKGQLFAGKRSWEVTARRSKSGDSITITIKTNSQSTHGQRRLDLEREGFAARSFVRDQFVAELQARGLKAPRDGRRIERLRPARIHWQPFRRNKTTGRLSSSAIITTKDGRRWRAAMSCDKSANIIETSINLVGGAKLDRKEGPLLYSAMRNAFLKRLWDKGILEK